MAVGSEPLRDYTETEDGYIRAHWITESDAKIGEALGRTESGICSRRWKLRLLKTEPRLKPYGVPRWTAQDNEILERCFCDGYPDEQIAPLLGRSVESVARQRSIKGLLHTASPAFEKNNWTDEDDRVMVWMFEQGWSDDKIAQNMERTCSSVRSRRKGLGLWRRDREVIGE